MAKSALRRHNTEKIQKKWENLLNNIDPDRDKQCLSFGRIFSRDPIDCGSPRCPLCSFNKVLHPKKKRSECRKAEREAFQKLRELE